MPKKDFSQIAFDVVQRATGEKAKQQPKLQKEAAPREVKGTAQGRKTKKVASK